MTLRIDPEGRETRFLHRYIHFGGKRVLEIGSGDGRLTWQYAGPTRLTVGIDPDVEELQAALQDFPSKLRSKVSFAQASAIAAPFPTGSFEIALLAWSL
jgi:ubiquinone/menaquinone biosynthesis C-methylase UbiE